MPLSAEDQLRAEAIRDVLVLQRDNQRDLDTMRENYRGPMDRFPDDFYSLMAKAVMLHTIRKALEIRT